MREILSILIEFICLICLKSHLIEIFVYDKIILKDDKYFCLEERIDSSNRTDQFISPFKQNRLFAIFIELKRKDFVQKTEMFSKNISFIFIDDFSMVNKTKVNRENRRKVIESFSRKIFFYLINNYHQNTKMIFFFFK